MLQDLTGAVETLATRGHGRVLAVLRKAEGSFRDTLRAWQMVSPIEIAGKARDWISYPGIFAAGRVDEGMALLLGALPRSPRARRVLDYGCGSGVIGAAVVAQEPGIIARHARQRLRGTGGGTRERAWRTRRGSATRIADADARHYAAILSNPPLHQGVAEDHTLLEQLVADAPSHLAPGGVLQIVVQRRLPLDKLFAAHFGRADVVAENGRFRVWRARRA